MLYSLDDSKDVYIYRPDTHWRSEYTFEHIMQVKKHEP